MPDKIEITFDVIVHATEDASKILRAFEESFGLKEEEFSLQKTTGHFDNPIYLLNAKIAKGRALAFMKKFLGLLSGVQVKKLVGEIEERTAGSKFHVRLDKQELIKGNIVFGEKDTVKMRIHTPVYNKRDTVKMFTEIFQIPN